MPVIWNWSEDNDRWIKFRLNQLKKLSFIDRNIIYFIVNCVDRPARRLFYVIIVKVSKLRIDLGCSA